MVSLHVTSTILEKTFLVKWVESVDSQIGTGNTVSLSIPKKIQ